MTGGCRIVPLAPMHADLAAALHGGAVAPGEEAWDAPGIARLLATPGIFGLLAVDGEAPVGFLLARAAGGEAEILTVAIMPDHRRRGIGRRLLMDACDVAHGMGAERMLLEVAEDNAPARALYAALGLTPVGRRRGYYRRIGGAAADALILARALVP